MKIIWSNQAVAAFWSIRDYIFDNFGIEAEEDYLKAVDDALQQATTFPGSGVTEYDLSADGSVQSILVNKRSRIIYYIENDILHVADVWSLRQNPDMLYSRFEK